MFLVILLILPGICQNTNRNWDMTTFSHSLSSILGVVQLFKARFIDGDFNCFTNNKYIYL